MAKDNQTYREDEGAPGGLPNGQSRQVGQSMPPVEGAEGFTGADSGPALGVQMIEGKKGTVSDRPIWSQQSSGADQDTAAPSPLKFGGQDSTDEYASYKKPQQNEGIIQTFRTSAGAGDAGTAGSDEPDSTSQPENIELNTQKIGVEMPQTLFTDQEGGGAPKFKHGG